MENLIKPILYIVAAINLILSFVIFSRGFRELKNLLFALITLGTAFWSSSIIGFYSDDFRNVTDWIVLTHTFALFIATVFFYFTLTFPQEILKDKLIRTLFSIPFLVTTYFILFSDKIVSSEIGVASYSIHQGYVFYSLFLIGYFFSGFYFLTLQYKKSETEDQRHQVKYVLGGSMLASTLAIVPDLILPYFDIFSYTWTGPLFTLIMVISIFIAMLKFHLFNIRIIVTELFVGVIVVVLFIELFIASSVQDLIIKTFVLIFISIFSYLLIKGVYREVEQREKIEILAKELDKANERLKEFLSLATHQIRAPIAAIRGYASEILEGDFGEVTPTVRETVEIIASSSGELAHTVQDFLDISRIEQNSMKYDYTEFDLNELVQSTVNDLKPNIEKKKLSLNIELASEPLPIKGDKGKLQQVLANVIDNSNKYTSQGGITISTKVENGNSRITIKDTGIGIKPETMGKLFQKFSRAEDATKANILGTGLGLYLARQLVEAQNGKIWAESEGDGKGSTFIIELPKLKS